MPKKIFSAEAIISKLREAEVLLSQGQPLGTVCRGPGISEQTYYTARVPQAAAAAKNMAVCARNRRAA